MVRFAAFLREIEAEKHQAAESKTRWIWILTILVFLISSVGIAVQVPRMLGAVCPLFILFFAAAVWFHTRWSSRISRKAILKDPLESHYQEMIEGLRTFAVQGTLSERIHPALSAQLESTFSTYFQVRDWLKTPSSVSILGQATHREVQESVRRAVREAVFSIYGFYRVSGMQRKTWQKRIEADPNAEAAAADLARVCALVQQIAEIAEKSKSLGRTISLMDQLQAVKEAIEELESNSISQLRALPAPKRS
jgi:ABC-type multidrug transport system fused ATPase/permease subunit